MDTYDGQNLVLQNQKLELFYGLNSDSFTSSGQKQFNLDLTFDKIIFNIFPDKCEYSINCQVDSGDPEESTYKNKPFTYKTSHVLLSWEHISSKMIKSEEQFDYLKSFDVSYVNYEGQQNGK